MLMNYVFTLDSFFKLVLLKTQNKPLFYSYIVLLIYVNKTIYLYSNLTFFKIHVYHFMAWDDSPGAIL